MYIYMEKHTHHCAPMQWNSEGWFNLFLKVPALSGFGFISGNADGGEAGEGSKR